MVLSEVKGLRGEMLLYVLAMTTALASAGKSWSKGHDHNNLVDVSGPKSHLEKLEVVCSRDHMTVHMHFDQPFYGVVFSHGSGSRHERCVHVGPRAGITSTSFDIKYDGCGTVEHLSGQFHENTIVIQFDEDILEAWDEAKRLRCEWLESFEKPSSKPTLAISDLDVVELNFQGDDIDCWMEVQEGKGPWARQVGGLVPIGSPLTLVIAINDHSREFDMRIKRCSASDGKGNEIELTDQNGCVLRPSLLTPFAKIRDFGGKATLVTYSHLYAFKFPDKMDVFVHCIVEVCRHGCPDSCSHQYKDYHRPSGSYDSLESKKIQKLKEFANSKSAHDIHVSGHHKIQGSGSNYPIPGDVLVPAAQTQVKHVTVKNTTFNAAVSESHKVVKADMRPSFKPIVRVNKLKEAKSQAEAAASNVQAVFANVDNNLQSNHHSKISHSSLQKSQSSEVHRLVGHDVHWISDVVDSDREILGKPHLPSLKDISYQAPKPEPSSWSADEVKPITEHEVFKPHQPIKSEFETSVHQQIPPSLGVSKTYSHLSSGNTKSHSSHHTHLHDLVGPVPQPEPATWSGDDVKPLTKDNVFGLPEKSHSIPKITVVHESNIPEIPKTYTHWSSGNIQTFPSSHPKGPVEPKPEPAAWSFDEVNPMHSPEVIRLQLHTKRPDEPKPEPNSWTLEEVKGLTKEELRLLSLNHKMQSQGRVIAPPVYKEFVHPYSTTTIPQPVYVSRYTLSPQNISSTNMMKMMMMMPTMLPATYQSAYWPQRTTARYLKPQRHHYPYPIPQFSPHQQMMMSVIADRRMDGENEEDSSSKDLTSHKDSNLDESPETRRIEIGETANGETSLESKASQKDTFGDMTTTMLYTDGTNGKIMIGEIFESRTTPGTKPVEDNPEDSFVSVSETAEPYTFQTLDSTVTMQQENSSEEVRKSEGASAVRPPISGFVPPSLDEEIGINPESKERIVPVPRALERKKRSSEPVFGVQQKFQAIAPSDLAYEWNLTSESAALLKGIREEIVYGICISPAGMSAGVGLILILTLLSIIASVILYEHSCRLSHKTSQLSFLTKNFNGQFEALYRFTRPYLYPDSRNVR